jgi:hypothetical protein
VDATIVLNVTALVISLAALVVSGYLTLRQIRLASGGNQLPVILDAFKESRDPAWFEAQEYVLSKLTQEHPAHGGHRGLPEPTRTHTAKVGLFYDDLGKLVAYRVVDEKLVIGSYGTMITRLWDVVAPYVYEERRAHGLHFWVYFEDLAARTAANPPEAVYSALRLRSRPPRLLVDS